MTAPTVIIRNLSKNFQGTEVLDGVDLDIKSSRINFIIGQSGCGKSVLLKHMVGLLTPDTGEIWYDNKQVVGQGSRQWHALRMRSALLFQEGALFDSMSVGENVSFPLWFHKRATQGKATALARQRLRELDMKEAFDHRPSDLSVGEKKRVALARALIMDPEILFFDEPTTGLDPLLSGQVDELIRVTSERTGATMVVVSHDIPATLSLAHHIAMIHEGRIVHSGSPEEFQRTSDPVVQQFLAGVADGPMGFLD